MGNEPLPAPGTLDFSLRSSFPGYDEPFPIMPSGPSIPPVRLRTNAGVPSLNRGVYSSWEREGTEESRRSGDLSSHGAPGIISHSTQYESLDLLRLLNEDEGRVDGGAAPFDSSFFMDLEENKRGA